MPGWVKMEFPNVWSETCVEVEAVERYFSVVLVAFQFYPVSNFGKFIKFG